MSQTITFAPALVNVCAIPLPIPFAPPVTIAMLFFKSNILNISFNDYCQNQMLFIYYLNTLSLKNYSELKDTGQEWKIVVSTVIIVKKTCTTLSCSVSSLILKNNSLFFLRTVISILHY